MAAQSSEKGGPVTLDGQQCVVMVAEDAFHLGWMGSTRRILHLAGAFRELGYGVVLVSGRCARIVSLAEVERRFPGPIIRTRHSGHYPPMIEGSALLKRAWRAGWKLCGQDFYYSRLSWGWAEGLPIDSTVARIRATGHLPIAIWGVSAGYLGGAVGAMNIARALEVPWVLELHDPPRRAGLGVDLPAVRSRFEGLLLAADSVVVNAMTYGERLATEYPKVAERLHVVPLTYEQREVRKLQSARIFKLTYTGSLDSGRSLKPLIAALERLLREDPRLATRIQVVVAGRGSGLDALQRFASTSPAGSMIDIRGAVSQEEAYGLQDESNALVVVQPSSSSLEVPGKVFELLSLGKPIVGMVPLQSEVASILHRSGLGLTSEPSDVDGLERTLRTLVSSWESGVQPVRPDVVVVEEYSLGKLPERLHAVLPGTTSRIAAANDERRE